MGASCVMRCHTWCFLCLSGVMRYQMSYMGASCAMRCHSGCFLWYEVSFRMLLVV